MGGYVPATGREREEMLKAIGLTDMEELFAQIPSTVRLKEPLDLPEGVSEMEMMAGMRRMAGNTRQDCAIFLGAGAYDRFIPSVVPDLANKSAFLTAYTPYQPEMSQGLLQAMFEYQSMICRLTGMDVANASVYDGATAAAEAMLMARAVTGRSTLLVSEAVHPQTVAVLETYAAGLGMRIECVSMYQGRTHLKKLFLALHDDVCAVLLQNPNFFGCLEEMHEAARIAHAAGALLIVSASPISLGMLAAPGALGADIAVGDVQELGNPLNFGGPYAGYMAAKQEYMRKLPGRIVGQTKDEQGRRGFVLTLQTREQHIRREKATSNICSNQAHSALTAAIYLAAMGPQGLYEAARLSYNRAHYLRERITALPGFEALWPTQFFHEFAVRVPVDPDDMNKELLKKCIIGGYNLGKVHEKYKDCVLFCVTEMNTRAQMDALVGELEAMTK
ncbi:MAG: aminomethyl-transferring glycine dehydrogenase subunit GcvPA [Bacillota bacterium]